MNELELMQAVKNAAVKLMQDKLLQGTFGNISVRLDEKRMLISPYGANFDCNHMQEMVIVDVNTLQYDGKLKPATEKNLHAAIYRTRPELNAIIHSHSVYCCSVAAARRDLPLINDDLQKKVGGAVRIADYALPGTKKSAEAAIHALTGRKACLMSNHGMMACGETLEEAVEVCYLVEDSCRAFIERETLYLSEKDTFSIDDLFVIFKASTQK